MLRGRLAQKPHDSLREELKSATKINMVFKKVGAARLKTEEGADSNFPAPLGRCAG